MEKESYQLLDFYSPFVNNWIDYNIYCMLQFYFAPAFLMSQGTEVDQWISKFSTNGIKQFSICR